MELPPSVLVALYEARVKVRAALRADQADDTAAAIAGCLGEEGHKSLRAHIDRLRALAMGESYTEDTPDVVHL